MIIFYSKEEVNYQDFKTQRFRHKVSIELLLVLKIIGKVEDTQDGILQ